MIRKGDLVETRDEYKWKGEVVAVFKTIGGHNRVVIECTSPALRHVLHISSPYELKVTGKRAVPLRFRNRIKKVKS